MICDGRRGRRPKVSGDERHSDGRRSQRTEVNAKASRK